ncbi:hypothetical protein [Xylanibacter oryzae]|uniref:hypothetical protein n=1 Tax=Xylanibacter oryzae TaxID=185293 RepID=UPI0004BBC846|nr:hypothetical protein [Xylanibacter oryzae]
MYKFTEKEKERFLEDTNKKLAKIPGYNISVPEIEIKFNDVYKDDKGYYYRILLERNEYRDIFLGENMNDALIGFAMEWIWTYALNNANSIYPEESMSQIDIINKFKAFCSPYLD